MKKTDVLIIGGSAAGMVAAVTGKSAWEGKSFTLVKKQKDVMVPCGIPYIFGTLDSSQLNIMPVDNMLEKAGIESILDEAIAIDKEAKTVTLKESGIIGYDKLVIGTGSLPVVPKWLKGTGLDNVFVISKDKEYLDTMKERLAELKRVVIIGAGFIGVEFADELNKVGHDVTLIEKESSILYQAFDKELADRIDTLLLDRGVKTITGNGIKEIAGPGKVEKVILENGDEIDADAVVLSVGYRPNTELAKNAGIDVDDGGFIEVDEYMRTHYKDIFAIGDCAQKRDFITRKRVPTMLASTACAEARVAGMNLFNIHVLKTFSGTISIYSTAFGCEYGFGTAGITERRAVEEGISIVTGIFEGIDKHPGTLPNAKKQLVKLIVAKQSGVIIGGEVIGGPSAGELTNVIGFVIENRMSVNSVLISQVGTHPCLTASPAAYPLIKAAEVVSAKIHKL